MQSIERYGVVALCFLIVTMVAVWLWDDHVTQAGDQSSAAGAVVARKTPEARETPPASEVRVPRAEPATEPERSAPETAGGSIVAATSPAETGPLSREKLIERRKAEARARLERERAEEEARRLQWEEEQRRTHEERSLAQAPPSAEPESSKAVKKPVSTNVQSGSKARGGLRPYVIRADDTLSQISQRELGTMHRWGDILAVNPGLNPDRLPVGVEILLPADGAVSSTPGTKQKASSTPAAGGGGRHVVASGESLWIIAADRLGDGTRWREIAALNPAIDPERLRVGDVLELPGGSRAPQRAQSGPKVANREQARSRTRGKVL